MSGTPDNCTSMCRSAPRLPLLLPEFCRVCGGQRCVGGVGAGAGAAARRALMQGGTACASGASGGARTSAGSKPTRTPAGSTCCSRTPRQPWCTQRRLPHPTRLHPTPLLGQSCPHSREGMCRVLRRCSANPSGTQGLDVANLIPSEIACWHPPALRS